MHKISPKETFAQSRFSKPNLVIFGAVFALIGVYVIFRSFAASPTTYYVATTGADSNTGSQSQPFLTITKAVTIATTGDTVLVNSGVYHEYVSITKSGITLRGIGTTKPIIDGDNVRSAGVYYGSQQLVNEVVDNFEIRNLWADTVPGRTDGRTVAILGYNVANSTFQNNDIHDIHGGPSIQSYGFLLGNNDTPYIAQNINILNNQIHSIGPSGESMGIWLLYTQNIKMDGNTIYMVRKEGIRDWHGKNNIMTNNRAFLNWIGFETETAEATYIANNYAYNNVFGFTTKHPTGLDSGTGSCPTKPDTYDKDANGNIDKSKWTRIWHNTAYNNTEAGIAIGMSEPQGDYIDVQDNIFASNGNAGTHNWPYDTCGHVVLDNNVYSRRANGTPQYDYLAGWGTFTELSTTVADISNIPYNDGVTTQDNWFWPGWFQAGSTQRKLGYEAKGQDYNMTFKDALHSDLDYNTAPPNPGAALGDSFGSQIGARGLSASTVQWTQYPITAIAASINGPSNNFGNANRTTDDIDATYWWSSGASDPSHNQWITYDLGSAKPIQQFVATVFAHYDNRNTQNYKFEVSNDNVSWQTVLAGTNPDPEGSSYKYQLAQPITARYVKYTMVDTFGSIYGFVFPDFEVGIISGASSGTTPPPTTPPPTPPPSSSPPTVSISANPTTIYSGTTSTITWSSTNTTSCSASGAWSGNKALSGSEVITAVGASTYTLTCTGTGGSISKYASVDATTPLPAVKVGDINSDGSVNIFDMSILLSKYNSTDTTCDVNKDGIVNIFDLSILLSHYGT
jgi:parallel beta-helix repeat protein